MRVRLKKGLLMGVSKLTSSRSWLKQRRLSSRKMRVQLKLGCWYSWNQCWCLCCPCQ
jgi:hypothetical protein